MSTKISVYTALFNHESFIHDCLNSALNQTLTPSEIIVLDDASTDNSLGVLEPINNPLIKTIVENNNLGGANTSKGLEACKGDFIALLNSDDVWAPEKLEKQLNYIEQSTNIGAVFTHICAIDESGTPWSKNTLSHQKAFDATNRSRHHWLRYFFLHGNPFCASSAFIRKECIDKSGSFNGSYIQLQDLDMWIRIALEGYNLYVIEEPLTYYRIMKNADNMSSGQLGNRATYSFEYAKILRNFWSISSLEDLTRIFPDINIAEEADNSLILFYLAQYAVKQPTIHHQLFALESMSIWGGGYDAMNLAYRCHGFDFSAYRDFLARGPIRTLSRLSLRHNINSLALKVLPNSVYKRLKKAYSK